MALLVALAGAPQAVRGDTVGVPSSRFASALLVPGGGVAWIEDYRRDGFRVFQAEPGGSRRMVFRSARDPVFYPLYSLAAGSGFLVVGQGGRDPTARGQIPNDRDYGTTVLRADGSVTRFASPCPYDACSEALAGGRAFAYLVRSAAVGASLYDTIITDVDSGETARVNAGGDGSTRLAGRYFSYADNRDAVRARIVYDWRAGREAYRIPTSSIRGTFALQDDGKSAFATPAGGLAWASPAAPFAHPLPVARGYDYRGLRMARDSVLFSRTPWASWSAAPGELGVASLDGPARLLRRGVFARSGADGQIDFDGTRALWVERTCAGTEIRVATLAELVRRPRLRQPACELRLGRVTVARGRMFARIGCGPFGRRSCAVGNATVRAARTYRDQSTTTRRGAVLATRRRQGDPPGRVGFTLTPAGRRLFADRAAARVRVRVLVRYTQGDSQRRAARAVARRSRSLSSKPHTRRLAP